MAVVLVEYIPETRAQEEKDGWKAVAHNLGFLFNLNLIVVATSQPASKR